MIGLNDILMAARTIEGAASKTSLAPSMLSNRLGGALWLKLETCQPMGAFTLRGAADAVANHVAA